MKEYEGAKYWLISTVSTSAHWKRRCLKRAGSAMFSGLLWMVTTLRKRQKEFIKVHLQFPPPAIQCSQPCTCTMGMTIIQHPPTLDLWHV